MRSDLQPQQAPDAEPKAVTSQSGWARLPNEVVRDRRLAPEGLVLVAYRSTFGGAYALNETALRVRPIVRGAGLGRNPIRRAISQMRAAGYLKRWQPPSKGHGSLSHAVETLTLPPSGASGRAYRIVQRAWFDGALSLKEMAAYLYLRCGSGRGQLTFARELAARFGWSRPTATKVISSLAGFGLLAKREKRSARGRVTAVAYETLAPEAVWHTDTVPLPKNRATSYRSTRIRATHGKLPPHGLATQDPSSRRLRTSYAARAAHEQTLNLFDNARRDEALHQDAMDSPTLLGWIGQHEQLSEDILEIEPEAVAAVANVLPDNQLKAFLVQATAGRAATEILSPPGLYAVRWLAASLVDPEQADTPTPADAIVAVLNAIWTRIGARRAWLNSLAVIGQRMVGEAYSGGRLRFFVENGQPMFRVTRPPADPPQRRSAPASKRQEAPTEPNLKLLFEADGARTLAPKLLRDPAGLRAFLEGRGIHALEIMASVLRRNMIGDKGVHSIRSWGYFDDAIAEELHLRKISALGIRPGDVFGGHRWRPDG